MSLPDLTTGQLLALLGPDPLPKTPPDMDRHDMLALLVRNRVIVGRISSEDIEQVAA